MGRDEHERELNGPIEKVAKQSWGYLNVVETAEGD
jgi:hypothetical protein